MTWRSVVIANPATLRFRGQRLVIEQPPDEVAVPLEDIAVLVLESREVFLTSRLLSECMEAGVTVLTVGADHHPNGALLPFSPHSRALKMLNRQMSVSMPLRKRLWQGIVRQKIQNQARCLDLTEKPEAGVLRTLALQVKSGDPQNLEAVAARRYFVALFGKGFRRSQEGLINSALNYGYSVLRASLARSLTSYGFLPVIGLHHSNEQNAFNLADDLIEPFRPLVDLYVAQCVEGSENDLTPTLKANLVRLLHHDISIDGEGHAVLAAIDACVVSLGQCLDQGSAKIKLPILQAIREHGRE